LGNKNCKEKREESTRKVFQIVKLQQRFPKTFNAFQSYLINGLPSTPNVTIRWRVRRLDTIVEFSQFSTAAHAALLMRSNF